MTKREFVKFIRFLKRNQILPKYVKNYIENQLHSIRPRMEAEFLILDTFVWCKTPEGSKFWSTINSRWDGELRSG